MANLITGYQIAIPFELSGSNGSLLFSGSYVELNSTVTSSAGFFVLKHNNEQVFKVNKEAVVEFKNIPNTPTVVTGGMFYSASDWYLYYDN